MAGSAIERASFIAERAGVRGGRVGFAGTRKVKVFVGGRARFIPLGRTIKDGIGRVGPNSYIIF